MEGKSFIINQYIISIEKLLQTWKSFIKGKKKQKDVSLFDRFLEDNIWQLHNELISGGYKHGEYENFNVSDTKKRSINKASVKDRLIHRLVWVELKKVFEPLFIKHLYSSIKYKGHHKMIRSILKCCHKIQNEYKKCFILHMDIRKYFDSMNKSILLKILKEKNIDQTVYYLSEKIVHSFGDNNCGVPLGNITSQIFANIYLNDFDWLMIKEKRCFMYFRYNDDIFILNRNREFLYNIANFSKKWLLKFKKLDIPTEKIKIKKFINNIDVLGFIISKDSIKIRTSTKNRIYMLISRKNKNSYFGVLSHSKSFDLIQRLRNVIKNNR